MACTPLTERHWAPMEGHPETFISSKNQQFEPPQLVTQAWMPIHRFISESNPHRQPDTRSAYVSHRRSRRIDPGWWTMSCSYQSALTAGHRT